MKDLKLSLIVSALDRATAPLRKVGEGLKSLQGHSERLHKALHKLGLAEFVGAAFFTGFAVEAGRGIFELTNKTAELGESFHLMSMKMGVSVEAAQRLGFAAKQTGVDAESLGLVFFQLNRHIAEAVKGNKETAGAFKLLGMSLGEVKALSRNPEEALMRVSEGFRKLKNPAAQSAVVMDLFSRSGRDIIPMLMAGRDALKGFEDQLDANHAVISKEDAEASVDYIRKKNELGLAWRGLVTQISTRLIPVMTSMFDKLRALIVKLRPDTIDKFTKSLADVIDQVPALITMFAQLVESVADLVPGFVKFTEKIGGLKIVLGALATLIGVNLSIAFGGLAIKVATGLVAFLRFTGAVRGLIALGALVRTFTLTMWGLDAAMAANPVGLLVIGITALAAALGAVGFAVWTVYKNWDGITKWFSDLFNRLGKVFSDGWNRISAMTPDWMKTILKIGVVGIAMTSPLTAAPALAYGARELMKAAPASPFASSPAGRSSPFVGTITVKAEPGTKVSRIASSTPAVEFSHQSHWNRGTLPD